MQKYVKETPEDVQKRVNDEGLLYNDSWLDPLIPLIHKLVVEYFEGLEKTK